MIMHGVRQLPIIVRREEATFLQLNLWYRGSVWPAGNSRGRCLFPGPARLSTILRMGTTSQSLLD
jgi:hypothetical protein